MERSEARLRKVADNGRGRLPVLPTVAKTEFTKSGRRLEIWRTDSRPIPVGAAIVVSGFGHAMTRLAGVALYLGLNGFVTYRFDGPDHVGLGDGDASEYTMSVGLEGLKASVRHALDECGRLPCILVASSLAARIAIRLLAVESAIGHLLTLVGVVDARKTLASAVGVDYMGWRESDLPQRVEFDGHPINAPKFIRDAKENQWLNLSDTVKDLARTEARVTAFCTADDEWVDVNDVRRAFREGVQGPREIVIVPRAGHEIGRNAAATRQVLEELVHYAVAPSGREDDVDAPTFSQVVEQSLYERSLATERQQLEARV